MEFLRSINKRRFAPFSVVLCVIIAVWVLWHDKIEETHAAQAQLRAWYTDDDGQTWFVADKRLLSPFDHNGRPAYQAYLFSADGGKTQFVGYMERYTPEAIDEIHRLREASANEPPKPGVFERISMTEVEIKKPGQSSWINIRDPRAAAIKTLQPPAGAQISAVMP